MPGAASLSLLSVIVVVSKVALCGHVMKKRRKGNSLIV